MKVDDSFCFGIVSNTTACVNLLIQNELHLMRFVRLLIILHSDGCFRMTHLVICEDHLFICRRREGNSVVCDTLVNAYCRQKWCLP